jgi:hypothetical protein
MYLKGNYVGHMGHMINACSISISKPVGKKYLVKPTFRRKNNIKMYLQEIQQYAEICIRLAQERARLFLSGLFEFQKR